VTWPLSGDGADEDRQRLLPRPRGLPRRAKTEAVAGRDYIYFHHRRRVAALPVTFNAELWMLFWQHVPKLTATANKAIDAINRYMGGPSSPNFST
jgi:hypothetical protein